MPSRRRRDGKSERLTNFVIPATVMLSFISFWRAAAIVLCDLGSSAYYVGGIAEKAIGKAAPWFVLAIMLFFSLTKELLYTAKMHKLEQRGYAMQNYVAGRHHDHSPGCSPSSRIRGYAEN